MILVCLLQTRKNEGTKFLRLMPGKEPYVAHSCFDRQNSARAEGSMLVDMLDISAFFEFFFTFLWHCGHDLLYLKNFKDTVPVSHTGQK